MYPTESVTLGAYLDSMLQEVLNNTTDKEKKINTIEGLFQSCKNTFEELKKNMPNNASEYDAYIAEADSFKTGLLSKIDQYFERRQKS
ncbi:MAG: hypothetical protein SNF33_03990 [Candidatus Algichlamydia australiensis]|nr:hypothetical protein [Chlamydiales bacterium]